MIAVIYSGRYLDFNPNHLCALVPVVAMVMGGRVDQMVL